MAARLRCEIFSADLDATMDFYVRVLAFTLHRDEREAKHPYLAVVRDGVHIGAALRPDVDRLARRPPIGVEVVVEVDDLDACCAQVVASGWALEEGMRLRPWGKRDFRLLDPNGYYLRITDH